MTGATARLVDRVRSLRWSSVSDDARLVAKTCVLDWLGCAVAGTDQPLVHILVEQAAHDGCSRRASVIGRHLKTSPGWAATINGASAHALDYDDTHVGLPAIPIHPTTPVLSGILALAEERRASGPELLSALIAGVETECRMGALMGPGHYEVGWHATATLGTFGATAACAHMLGLDELAWRHALGIAATQAAGLKSVFGSMSKPLQVGRAAASGLLAATLAAHGFTSNTDIIEGEQGFAALYQGALLSDESESRLLIRDTVFKRHASCYLTQSAIEATLRIVEEHKVTPDRAAKIDIVVPAGHLDVCNIAEPRTGLEGKFSLRATVAMALHGDDTSDPTAYADERMTAADIVATRDKVTVRSSSDIVGTQTRVTIGLADGSALTELADVGVPAVDLERQWDSVTSKFVRLTSPGMGERRAWEVSEMVHGLERVSNITEVIDRVC